MEPLAIAAATNGWQTLAEGLQMGYRYGESLGWDMVLPALSPAENQ